MSQRTQSILILLTFLGVLALVLVDGVLYSKYQALQTQIKQQGILSLLGGSSGSANP